MIDFIEGKIAYTELDHVVIDTGHGVGYRIFCGNPFQFESLLHQADNNNSDNTSTIRLFTHYYVREDATHLYGFATREERELFRMLLDVSGIGPKGALAIVSAAAPQQIAAAIQQEDVTFLTRFPGIGKKTAQRIVLDLKDKIEAFASAHALNAAGTAAGKSGATDSLSVSGQGWTPQLKEAVEALKALGYHDKEIASIKDRLADEMQEQEWTTDQAIRRALQLLTTK